MFLDQLIFWADLGLTGAALVVLTVVAMEVGFRLGRRRQKKADESARTQFTAIEGAELTVVGLLLAFTFSMAVSRFETRKQIVVNEANALGTAYLRAQLLPPLERLEAEALLRNYVDTWLELHDAGPDQQRHDAAIRKLDELQTQLWTRASAAARRNATSVTMPLLLQALNDVFDRQAELLAAVRNRVPGLIVALLIVGAVLALAQVGYGCGLTGHRSLSATITLCLLIAAIIVTTLDLDRPARGLLRLDTQSMLVLRASMNAPGP